VKVILTGGGTGGHLYPAISIGQALRAVDSSQLTVDSKDGNPSQLSTVNRQPSTETDIHFVGTAAGPEARVAPEAGFAFHALPSRPLSRRPSVQNAAALAVLGWGTLRAMGLLRQLRPDVVVGTGGYVSAGLVLAAALRRIPTVIHEQNAIAGRTNRLLGCFATRVAITFEESASFFPAGKTVVTGLPIRPEITTGDAGAARRQFDLDASRPVLLVVGGSRGAARLNRAVEEALPSLLERGVQIIHQLGKANFDEARTRPQAGYRPTAYIESMGDVLAASDLILCRAGASTLAEVAAVGRPSLLVPYPYAADDHQTANARVFALRGAAALVPDAELDGRRLLAEAVAVLEDPERRARMAAASRTLGRPDAAVEVAELVRSVARR
jgi:UDP-N-acetylglucosamine--N-acetylmuramyl-(pentapeptide) pyrophosphoryl-undecaprenol N-acetylglucosamine transferase